MSISKALIICGFFLAPSFSYAQKNPTYFTWSGEYRTRYEFLAPPAGEGNDTLNIFSHRFILETNFKPKEDIEIQASLLLSENLGQDFRGFAGYKSPDTTNDEVSIYELYASWLSQSGLSFKIGRFLFAANNESFFSKNFDDPIPTRFDGGLLKYDKDYFNFEGGAFLVSQFQDANLKTETSALFLISVDLKIDQGLLKNVNLSFVSYDTNEKTFPSLNNFVSPAQTFTMYSASLTGELGRFYYSTDAAIQQGDNSTTDQLMDTFLFDGKFGFTLNRASKFKVYSQFHKDTGDKGATSDIDESYNPLFYNHFLNAGRMNLLAWGNLTTLGLGTSFKWSDSTIVCLEYNKFLRSTADSGINGLSVSGTSPLTLDGSGTNSGPFDNNLASEDKNIGDELDLIVDFNSEIGLKFQSITGVFQPGGYLEVYNKTKLIVYQRFGLEFLF